MEHHFFAYVSRMRLIRRWSLMRNTFEENDMEHSFQTAMIAHAIALIGNRRYGRHYDPDHMLTLAAYHDACEVITGDLPTPIKHRNAILRNEYGKVEEEAAETLLSMLPEDLRGDYRPLIEQYMAEEEKRIVKAADRISAYIKCLEEKKAGNLEFESARKSILESIDAIGLPEVSDFMKECVPGFSLTLDEISRG